ncbi:MAG: tripartite tricarboxylate transporter substrate binding protein [Betaproteobacteria bacterium]
MARLNFIKSCRLALSLMVLLNLFVHASVNAQAAYPDRPIKLVVPYPPGGTTDLLARTLAPRLSERLGQPILIENRAGAGGVIGSQVVAKSPADGYTLVFGSIASHGILPAIQTPQPYDPIRDFAPVSLVAITPNVLLANVSAPAKNLSELIALAKSQPGKLNFGSTSLGGSPHMSGELLKSQAKIQMVHVPYKGGAPMLVDLMGGQISFAFDNLPSSIQHIRSGKVKALAVTTAKRWPHAPEIPTMAEAGLPGYESSAWFGLLAPGNTPKAVVDLLQRHVSAILKQPEVEKIYLEQGAMPVGNTSEEFVRFITAEMQKWKTVVSDTGVKLD